MLRIPGVLKLKPCIFNPLDRELHEIASALGLQVDTAEEECNQSSSTQPQQQTYASIMLKQGFSTLQAGVSLVKSVKRLVWKLGGT